ncbi:hypothetical protein [Pseudomonas sp. GZD-222]|uniref:hypothetical protein n=1 Tax=Pseudomonas sp. GZD-222 TaxID=3404805 RepID=UPI003BB607B5
MKASALKPLFFGAWLPAVGALCYVLTLAVGVSLWYRTPEAPASLAWPFTWAVAAALWWLFHGPRLCSLTTNMIALRAPKVRRTLLGAVGLHMALSIAPPLMCLALWPVASHHLPQLAAALWLGSCFGLLTISMPWALNFIPVTLLALYWPVLANPGQSALLGVLALLLTWALWHYHSQRPRTKLMTPLGVALSGFTLGSRDPGKGCAVPAAGALSNTAADQNHQRQEPMAALLGRSCQTIKQIYGKRGQYLMYLALASVVTFVYWIEPDYNTGFLAMWAAVLLVWTPMHAIGTLIDLHGRNRATLAELLLAPGLPPREQLQATLLRQLRNSLLERQVLMTLLLVAMGINNHSPGLHRPLAAIAFSTFMLALSLGLARLAWRGALSKFQWGMGTALLMASIYIGTLMLIIF